MFASPSWFLHCKRKKLLAISWMKHLLMVTQGVAYALPVTSHLLPHILCSAKPHHCIRSKHLKLITERLQELYSAKGLQVAWAGLCCGRLAKCFLQKTNTPDFGHEALSSTRCSLSSAARDSWVELLVQGKPSCALIQRCCIELILVSKHAIRTGTSALWRTGVAEIAASHSHSARHANVSTAGSSPVTKWLHFVTYEALNFP